MSLVKPRGKCPRCQRELVRVGRDGPKGRYKCMNGVCPERGWFNRYGERR